MNSPEHRAIILSDMYYYTDFGAGYELASGSTWGNYWTVDFGSRWPSDQTSNLSHYQPKIQMYTCSYTSTSPEGGAIAVIQSPVPCQ